MPRLLDFRRTSLTLAALGTLVVLAACASGTGSAAVSRGVAPAVMSRGADPASQKMVLARADSAWRASSYPLATSLYETALAHDSSTSVAIFRLATLRAWDNQLDEGVRLYRRYLALEPRDTEGRLALARALAWSAKYPAALAIYDSVIAKDSTYRDAVVGRAQTLAWSGQLDESVAAYRQWTEGHPKDRDASLEYARALSWNGQLDEAASTYTQLASTGDVDAQKGLARIDAWKGDLRRSLSAWRLILDTHPNDAEALTGLAQVLAWQGRQSDAEKSLHHALRVNPNYGDARNLLRWVEAELKPSVTMTAMNTNDSDNNRAKSLLLDYEELAGWNTTLGGRYIERRANLAAVDSRVDAVNLFARWQPGTWQLRADGGVARHSSTLALFATKPRTIGNAALHAAGNLGRALTVAADASRSPFDETALLIANGVISSEFAGEAALALPARFTLSGAASHARLTGGTRDNARHTASSTLRWTRNRRWSIAIGARQFGYDTTSSDGYFAPRKYTLAEASGRGHVGGDLGWNADGDVGVGRQSIEFFGFNAGSRLAERVALSAGYRFALTREITLSAGYANVAGPGQTGGSEYSYYSFALRARQRF